VSLNNRISIRDSYEALEGVVDRQAVTVPGSGRSEATKDATTLVAEKA